MPTMPPLTSVAVLLLAGLAVGQQRSLSAGGRPRNRLPAGTSEVLDFSCPNDFGYYQHPTDCSQYYVCVFGGAMKESCTQGLVYSIDRETCDWPHNVKCNVDLKAPVSTVRVTDPRTSKPPTRNPLTPSVSSFNNPFQSFSTNSADKQVSTHEGGNRQGRIIQGRPQEQTLQQRFQESTKGNSAFESPFFSSISSGSFTFPSALPNSNQKNSERIALKPKPVTESTNIEDPFYTDLLNLTDDEYMYLYEDLLLEDYYDSTGPSPTTAKPAVKPPTRKQSQRRPAPTKTANKQRTKSSRLQLKPKSDFGQNNNHLVTNVWQFPPSRPAPLYPQPPAHQKATMCDRSACRLPDCSCGGKAVPGGILPQNVPQMVLLTFDDAVNDLNKELYEELFKRGRKNPNGCPIQSTFYISHEWTDYSQVQNLYAEGHEIASHSVTHSHGERFSKRKWAQEIAGQREIMAAYAGVRMDDIRGMRAPFLSIGGNTMFEMLYEQNFTYDSSMPVRENRPPSYPYTLDYKMFHNCMITPCPTNSFPGLWEVPMVMWEDLRGGRCSMGDACSTPPDAEGIYKMLIQNFERHYTTNRAPMGLFYHAAWFNSAPHHKEGFIAFLDTINNMPDVWLVTNWQAIQWMRDPVNIQQAKSFKPFQCSYPERPAKCKSHKVCNVWHKGGVRYMRTCQRCPDSYPWVGNTGVQSSLNDV